MYNLRYMKKHCLVILTQEMSDSAEAGLLLAEKQIAWVRHAEKLYMYDVTVYLKSVHSSVLLNIFACFLRYFSVWYLMQCAVYIFIHIKI